jgi:hypothetical protein
MLEKFIGAALLGAVVFSAFHFFGEVNHPPRAAIAVMVPADLDG